MAKYRIPSLLINGFELIDSLSDENFKSLISVIESSKNGEGILTLGEKLSLQIPISEDDSKEIMRAIFSMSDIFTDSKNTVEKFTNDFITSYKVILPLEEQAKLEPLRSKINKILVSFKSLRQTIKAKDLLLENSNNFSEARVISDIRIVYDDEEDLKRKEQIAVIIHNLRITYSDGNGDDKYFFVSLDLTDLGKLKEHINRALEKDTLIRTNNHELSFVDVQ